MSDVDELCPGDLVEDMYMECSDLCRSVVVSSECISSDRLDAFDPVWHHVVRRAEIAKLSGHYHVALVQNV